MRNPGPLKLLFALALVQGVLQVTASAAPFEDSLAQRAMACTHCHGAQGRAGPDGYYPRLAGKPQSYLYNQLLNFRDGRRQYGLMSDLIQPLSDAYLFELAGHFAAQHVPYPPPAERPAGAEPLLLRSGDPARQLPACTACHGHSLGGRQPAIPGLLGLPRDYLSAQLGAWRTGQRRAQAPDCMAEIARKLKPEEVVSLARWLAAQSVPADYRAEPPSTDALPLRCGSQP